MRYELVLVAGRLTAASYQLSQIRCYGSTIIGKIHCNSTDSLLRISRKLRLSVGYIYKKK